MAMPNRLCRTWVARVSQAAMRAQGFGREEFY